MLKDSGIFIKQTSPVLLAEINRVVAAILKKWVYIIVLITAIKYFLLMKLR